MTGEMSETANEQFTSAYWAAGHDAGHADGFRGMQDVNGPFPRRGHIPPAGTEERREWFLGYAAGLTSFLTQNKRRSLKGKVNHG